MRKFGTFIILALLFIFAVAAAASAGSFWGTKQGTLVQNMTALAPDVSKSRCDSVTGTKGVFRSYTTAGYYGVELDAVDNTGAAVKGKWYLNGKQVGVGTGPYKVGNKGGIDHSSIAFGAYSSAPRTLDFCVRRQ